MEKFRNNNDLVNAGDHESDVVDDEINENNVDQYFADLAERFETAELKNRFLENFENWIESQKDEIAERLDNFHLERDKIDFLTDNIILFTRDSIKNVEGVLEKVKSDISRSIANGMMSEKYAPVVDRLVAMDNSDLIKVLLRRSENSLSEDDLDILRVMNYFVHQGTQGKFSLLFDEINLSLFVANNLEDSSPTLHHELTHYALNQLRSGFANQLMLESINKNDVGNNYSRILLAINESAAHLAVDEEPCFDCYAQKVPPMIFKYIHQDMQDIVADKDQKEKDAIFAELYVYFFDQWKKSMSNEEVMQAAVNLKLKMKSLMNK